MSKYDECKKFCQDYIKEHKSDPPEVPETPEIKYQLCMQYMIGFIDGSGNTIEMLKNKEDK